MKTDLSPAQERERRISQRERLAAEAALLLLLRGTVRKAAGLVALEWADRRAETQRVLALRRATAVLDNDVKRDVLQTVGNVRISARKRLTAEVALAVATLRGHDDVAPRLPGIVSATATDDLFAQASASSVTSGFAANGILAAKGKIALRDLPKAVDAKLRSIAATEAGRAYNDQHDVDTKAFAEHVKGKAFAQYLMKRWDAEIDACDHCWPHDGETVRIGDDFSGGDEPGAMHRNCRCTDTIIVVSAQEYDAA